MTNNNKTVATMLIKNPNFDYLANLKFNYIPIGVHPADSTPGLSTIYPKNKEEVIVDRFLKDFHFVDFNLLQELNSSKDIGLVPAMYIVNDIVAILFLAACMDKFIGYCQNTDIYGFSTKNYDVSAWCNLANTAFSMTKDTGYEIRVSVNYEDMTVIRDVGSVADLKNKKIKIFVSSHGSMLGLETCTLMDFKQTLQRILWEL